MTMTAICKAYEAKEDKIVHGRVTPPDWSKSAKYTKSISGNTPEAPLTFHHCGKNGCRHTLAHAYPSDQCRKSKGGLGSYYAVSDFRALIPWQL